MPVDPVTNAETPAPTEIVTPAAQEPAKEAAPKEAATQQHDWNDPPQWAKDLGAKVDKLMTKPEASKQDPNGNNSTTVKETVETDLPPKVVAPKKPHVLTRFPKWL